MTNEQIIKVIEPTHLAKNKIKIDFKTRNSLVGIFIDSHDYKELKAKNFWRIVTGEKAETWKTSKDSSLSRIFNGSEFTKLSVVK